MIWLEFPPDVPCLNMVVVVVARVYPVVLGWLFGLNIDCEPVSGPDLAMRKLIFLDPAAPQALQ